MTDLCVISYDIGTTSTKTCLYRVGARLELLRRALHRYPLRVLPGGGVEQDPAEFWRAMALGTREVLAASGVSAPSVRALSFSSQMQGLILVDEALQPVRPAMSYLDSRGMEEHRRVIKSGLCVAGLRARIALPSLYLTGGVSASVKDPVWKYLWVKDHEPERFARVRYWLDIKEYLALRCTGRAAMTEDSAHATFLLDSRPGRHRWSAYLAKAYGVELRHLPEIIASTDVVGPLTAEAAADLGLTPGISVVAGGGDLTMTALGSGCVNPGDAHVYMGTSGWVSTVSAKRLVDVNHLMASIIGARPGHYNYIGEQETSGKCLDWARDHLALDGIGLFPADLSKEAEPRAFEVMASAGAGAPPGAGGVVFAPWLHGNRSPFEDPLARGIFFNVGLNTDKACLLRAVLEGVFQHKRWLLECMAKKAAVREPLRFAGGGAISKAIGQLLADIIGRAIEAVAEPQCAGATGAAALCALHLGALSGFDRLRESIQVNATYEPDRSAREVYERGYEVLRGLHSANRRHFRRLNGARAAP